ncbi:hypothetical protein [Paenibacillus sp. FSL M7-0420]|uniref:hypothetical protein n=1 Tax=Paenibacillus sp. FSL M7-0420 TaxID=2921609 RepID=UPI0030F5E5B6
MKYKAWRALDNEAINSALLDIATLHVKLALEYCDKILYLVVKKSSEQKSSD